MSYALVDCNNFYASCERVFNPALKKRPVCILSNNDGCIIARSNEVKAAGIPMGAPLHVWKSALREINAAVLSSNYNLYGDMSARVMAIMRGYVPLLEVYSIDEAFLDFSAFTDPFASGQMMRSQVYQYTGIPVSVGIGPTKTLAKVANHKAKKSFEGVFEITEKNRAAVLANLPVGEVWGIGHRSAEKLNLYGIKTAAQFVASSENWVQKQFSIVGLKTQQELKGIACLELEERSEPKKNIICSRSFGRVIRDEKTIAEAVATYAARAGEKLRSQDSVALGITTYIKTNPFRLNDAQYRNSATYTFPMATACTGKLTKGALANLSQIFRPGYNYHKAGVALFGLHSADLVQPNLFDHSQSERDEKLMQAFDAINQKHGRFKIQYASAGPKKAWMMKSERKSPNYTTAWSELVKIKI